MIQEIRQYRDDSGNNPSASSQELNKQCYAICFLKQFVCNVKQMLRLCVIDDRHCIEIGDALVLLPLPVVLC
jgi:hypothetical protein